MTKINKKRLILILTAVVLFLTFIATFGLTPSSLGITGITYFPSYPWSMIVVGVMNRLFLPSDLYDPPHIQFYWQDGIGVFIGYSINAYILYRVIVFFNRDKKQGSA
jgi:hypothetical protein